MLRKDHVKRGNWGQLWIDGHGFSNVKSVEWTAEASFENVAQVDSLSEAELQNGLKRSGELGFTKTDSYLVKMILSYLKTGKAQNFTIITSVSSDAEHTDAEKIKLTGCAFSKTGGKWEAGKIADETFPFTYTNEEPITWAEND